MSTTTNLETHKLSLSIRAFLAVIITVVGAAASFFYGVDRINTQVEETNRRIEQTNNLLITNHFKDSMDRNVIQMQLDYLKGELKRK